MGQEPQSGLNDEDQKDYDEAVEGIRQGYVDFLAGRTKPLDDVFDELRLKHKLPPR